MSAEYYFYRTNSDRPLQSLDNNTDSSSGSGSSHRSNSSTNISSSGSSSNSSSSDSSRVNSSSSSTRKNKKLKNRVKPFDFEGKSYYYFLDAFAKLRNATISFVMSIRSLVCLKQLGSHCRDLDVI